MLTWQLQLAGTRIEVDSIRTPALATLYNHICKHLAGEDHLYMYDISRAKGIYTVLTFIRNDNPDSFGLIVSAATHINPEIALLKSLEELCLTQAFACGELIGDKKRKWQTLKEHEVTDLHRHTLYYSTGRRSHEIDFISASNCHVKLSQMKDFFRGSDEEIMEYLVELFRQQNQPIFAADITRREIRECGFRVVRAIISGYNDLEVSHRFRQLKNRRLQEFQEKYNTQINNAPHPFP
jgi:thiazole/oxazole-forming peptide maturase SagD family component